jgi:hypothetical protein
MCLLVASELSRAWNTALPAMRLFRGQCAPSLEIPPGMGVVPQPRCEPLLALRVTQKGPLRAQIISDTSDGLRERQPLKERD